MHQRYDKVSLAFLEAIACGLPVVAHESPQLRWIAEAEEYLLDTDDESNQLSPLTIHEIRSC
jgi:hypothetical protein